MKKLISCKEEIVHLAIKRSVAEQAQPLANSLGILIK